MYFLFLFLFFGFYLIIVGSDFLEILGNIAIFEGGVSGMCRAPTVRFAAQSGSVVTLSLGE